MPVREVSAAPAPTVTSTDGHPREALLSVPATGCLRAARRPVRRHAGRRAGHGHPGSRVRAAPHGSGGLVGPGGIGNYLVSGHRSSSTAPFRALPSLRVGARVVVVTDSHRLVYEVVGTRQTSFRSERSLREQSAAVPGRPGGYRPAR